MTFEVKHISQSIDLSFEDVYAFASDPKNLPQWAEGLSGSITQSGKDWIADSPMGKIKIKFTPMNNLGVLDHDVTLPSGQTFHNPMRVLKNGSGSEIVFTLYRWPNMSDEEFERDAAQITKDLKKLKSLLENP